MIRTPWSNWKCCAECHRPAAYWAGSVESKATMYLCETHFNESFSDLKDKPPYDWKTEGL